MKYFFSAGEASGDIHAAEVMRRLREIDPKAQFLFLGGDAMAEAAGVRPLIHYERMAYMGFIDVAAHAPEVIANMRIARRALLKWRPDRVVLVDYPGFNLPLAEYAKGLGLHTDYYIAPKLWAWKAYRLPRLRRSADRVLSILPFEKEWFGARGLNVIYVGNPSVEEVERALAGMPAADEFMKLHSLDERQILAIVPGSRKGEIKANLPVMDAVARRHPELQAVVAGAPSIPLDYYRQFTSCKVIEATTLQLMARARAALVTSGTASLECALAGTPQVVCYRAVGWKWAADLFTRILQIPYVSLPNLIHGPIDAATRTRVNKEASVTGVRGCVVPEMLVHNCTPDAVDRQLTPLLADTPERASQLAGYEVIREKLHTTMPAAMETAKVIRSEVVSR